MAVREAISDQNVVERRMSAIGTLIEGKLTILGDMVERRLATMGPNMKYAMEVVLRLPLLLIMHQWLLMAPYSEYTILEVPLFLIRIIGGLLIFGCQEVKRKNLFALYLTFAVDVTAAWVMELSYWWIHNEATGTCDENSRLPFTTEGAWWLPLGFVALLQAFYMIYWNVRHHLTTEFGVKLRWIVVGYLFLHGICSLGYLLTILLPLYYYFYKLLFIIFSQVSFIIMLNEDEKYKIYGALGVQGFRALMPGKWISRDLHASFAAVYFCCCMLIDLIRLGMSEVFTLTYLTGLVGEWTTSLIILLSLASLLCIVSNCAVAITQFLVIGNVNFRAAFDVNVGSKVYIGTVTLSIQAGILSGPFYQRTENMGFVLLLIAFLIVCQLWDLSEQHFLFLLNSGETGKWLAYLRVTCFIILIITAPVYFIHYLSTTSQFDLWPLVNITGVTSLVSRSLLSVVEFSLVGLSWYIDDSKDIIADAIYYTRVLKSVVLIVCMALTSYYRLLSPFLDGPFVLNILLILSDFLCVSVLILSSEWKGFRNRRRLIQQIANIPDAGPEQIAEYEDVCSVCLVALDSGKCLECNHIFHTECLKRWFQVRATCPNCNAVVQSPEKLNRDCRNVQNNTLQQT